MSNMAARPKLDRLDQKILASLYRNARITKTEMGDEIGLSPTRCAERMQRLERAKIIRGYYADIDLRKLAKLSLFQVQVRLADTSPAKAQQFEHFIARIDEVLSCQAVLGSVDYFLTVVAPDIESFQSNMDEISSREMCKFEFVTFPVSKNVKGPHTVPLLSLIELSQIDLDEQE
jgi:Lrp/AsnC family transcriptional regulator of ectoine degradation